MSRPQPNSNVSATALRAFAVLEIVSQSGKPLSIGEVTKQTGLDRATCYRMLRTIEEAGFLVRDKATRTYRLSRRVITLAKHVLADDDNHALVSRTLKDISALTGETAHYSEIEGDSTVLTLKSKGTQLVAVDFRIGERCVLHATSVGKAILAFQPTEFIEEYLKAPLVQLTEYTIAEPRRLTDELAKIRDTGVAFDHYELALGMKCVAVPVRGPDRGVHSGISISGPDSRLTDQKLSELGGIIRGEVEKLSRVLLGES